VIAVGSNDSGQCGLPRLEAGLRYVPSSGKCQQHPGPGRVVQLIPSQGDSWQCFSLAGKMLLEAAQPANLPLKEVWGILQKELSTPKHELAVLLPDGSFLQHWGSYKQQSWLL